MKKLFILALVLLVLSVVLTFDAVHFYRNMMNGAMQAVEGGQDLELWTNGGTGLYLFLGLWEINGAIPYSEASGYLFPLCIAVAALWTVTALVFHQVWKKRGY